MGLGYPGGPIIEKLAKRSPETTGTFSRARMKDGSLDFSFSGLKTAVMLEIRKSPPDTDRLREKLAAKFQNSVLEEITSRVGMVLGELKPKSLVVGGGVACNQALREALQKEADSFGAALRIPPPKYCSDNAAMIAGLGAHQLSIGKVASLSATAVPYATL